MNTNQDQLYTIAINSYDINLIKKCVNGNYILNSMVGCLFDVDGSEQINNLILNVCGSKKPNILDYYIHILPSRVIFPDFAKLKEYVQFDCSNVKSKLRYNDFFIKAIKANNLVNAQYLYSHTPIDINKIFYKILEDGDIIFAKRVYEIYRKNNENNENNEKKIIYKNISLENMNNNYELFIWFNSIQL